MVCGIGAGLVQEPVSYTHLLPKDLRLKWGVKAADFDKQGRIFELYAIKSVSYTHLTKMINY